MIVYLSHVHAPIIYLYKSGCDILSQDLQLFERQWSSLFSSMEIESALSMQELSEAQVAEVLFVILSLP